MSTLPHIPPPDAVPTADPTTDPTAPATPTTPDDAPDRVIGAIPAPRGDVSDQVVGTAPTPRGDVSGQVVGVAPVAPVDVPDQVIGAAPSLLWYLTEPTRAAVGIGQFAATRSLLRGAPSGDGHTVLVLPGLGATDTSTATLRRFLTGLGYDVHGWGLGLNIGPSVAVVQGMRALLRELAVGGKVSVVGWSLGGIFGRELARDHPGMVRQVITLGSPYAMTDLRQTRVNPIYRLLARLYVAGADMPPPEHTRPPFPVPSTSVYSKSDGIVAWQACISAPGARWENVAVASSHLAYGYNAAVLWVIADRLAQRRDRWRPFTPPPGLARLFPAT